MELKGQQKQAEEFLSSWYFEMPRVQEAVLKGYAGVGKTWLVGYWIEKVLKMAPKTQIVVLAPTNKALDVLRSKCDHLDVSFRTIDSFLGNRIKKNDDGEVEKTRGKGSENPDLIICDEASMVKAEYRTDVVRRRVRTLWIGDPAQLPPINEKLSSCFEVQHSFELTEVVRYDGAIIKVATMLRQRIESGAMFMFNDVIGFKDQSGALTQVSMGNVHDWAIKAVQKGLDAKIVAFTNADVDRHNAIVHERLFPEAVLFGIGEKVIVNETFEVPNPDPNVEETDMLYNAETMTVVSCEENPPLECGVRTFKVGVIRDNGQTLEVNGEKLPRAQYELDVALDANHAARVHKELTNNIWTMRREGRPESEVRRFVELRRPLNKLAPLRHSYSCTVHKSQGSTYDICFCDWSSIYRCEDRARMMYVAATRPSKWLVLVTK